PSPAPGCAGPDWRDCAIRSGGFRSRKRRGRSGLGSARVARWRASRERWAPGDRRTATARKDSAPPTAPAIAVRSAAARQARQAREGQTDDWLRPDWVSPDWALRDWALRSSVLRGSVLRGSVLRGWVSPGWALQGWALPD